LRAADVQQRLLVPLRSLGTGGDPHGGLVAHSVSRERGAGEARPARGVGRRRSPMATDPHAGLLEPAAAAEGPAREGLRVHAPERAARGPDLQSPADHRRLPRRPSLRAATAGAAVGQRGSLRQADPRPRLLSTVADEMSTATTYADVVEGVRATIA